jgi:uncharacterized Ntn-hydrolase superfamily protein
MTKKLSLIAIYIFSLASLANAQQAYGDNPLVHTYSIVAIDQETGEMGVAVQSHWFSVGSIVIWGEAGVGVVATQSFVNPAYGPNGLKLMKMGFNAKEALDMLLKKDNAREVRQVAFLDAKGNVSAHTGANCIDFAGNQQGDGYSVQANLMASDQVWPKMANAFEASKGKPLAERLIAALESAQSVGGDLRGKQSAAILIVAPKSTGQPWVDRIVDLRVEDHPTPVKELKRLVKVHTAYTHMNNGDLAIEHNDIPKALKEYSAAEALFPDNIEMKYWHAVSLANLGRIDEAIPMFNKTFKASPNWKTVTKNIVKSGILTVSKEDLTRILVGSY